MKLVSLDFETANSSMASACQLGLFVYEDGEIKETRNWLLKPFHRVNCFTNSHIHGISSKDVENESEFYVYYEELKELCKDAVLVAHNASFDIHVLNAVCDIYGLDRFTNEYIDTVQLSRHMYPDLPNHRLDTMADYLNISLNHHEAGSDAFACLMILLLSMNALEIEDIGEFAQRIHVKIKRNQ